MDLLTFVLRYLSVPTVAILIAGFTYKALRYALFARVYTPKPEFRWREIAIKKGSFWDIGFWHWIRELLAVFLRPIIWSVRVNIIDFVGGLALLHIIGVIPILFLMCTHVSIWLNYLPYISIGPINLTPLVEFIQKVWYFFCIPVGFGKEVVKVFSTVASHPSLLGTIWSYLSAIPLVLNGDVLTILAIAAVIYKIVDHTIKVARGIINIRPGDYVALILLLCILVSGFVALHAPATLPPEMFRTLLGIHVLFAEIFFMTLPFTKFSHFLFGYWYGKIHELYDAYAKRGV